VCLDHEPRRDVADSPVGRLNPNDIIGSCATVSRRRDLGTDRG